MSSTTTSSRSRWRYARLIPLALVAMYVGVPILSSLRFAVLPGGEFSLGAYSVLAEDPALTEAMTRTAVVTVLCVAVLLVTLVPAVVAVHLWAPRLRSVLEIVCTLPLVIPPIALAAGIVALLRWGAGYGRGTVPNSISVFLQDRDLPLVLVGAYVVLCLPFTFRSLDAGLRTISLKAIVEASATLGSSTFGTIVRVVMPNIRGPVIYSICFAIAVCLSEFALAATLGHETVSVWIFSVSREAFRSSIAISVLLSLTTWILLITATLAANRFASHKLPDLELPDDSLSDAIPSGQKGTQND